MSVSVSVSGVGVGGGGANGDDDDDRSGAAYACVLSVFLLSSRFLVGVCFFQSKD